MAGIQVIGEMHCNVKKMKSITDPTFGKLVRNQYLMRVYNRWGLLSLYFLADSPAEEFQLSPNQTVVFRPEIIFQIINRPQIFRSTSQTTLFQPAPLLGQSSELEESRASGQTPEGNGEAGLGSQIHGRPFSKSIGPKHHLRYDSHITRSIGLRNAIQDDGMLTGSLFFLESLLSQLPLFHGKKDFRSPDSMLSQALPPLRQSNLALTFRSALQANFRAALNSVNQPNFISTYHQSERPKFISAYSQSEQLNLISAFSQTDRPSFTSASLQINQLSSASNLNPVNNTATRPGFTGVFTTLFQRGFSSPLKSQFTLVRNPAVSQRLSSNRGYSETSPLLGNTSEWITGLIRPKTPASIGGGYPRAAKPSMDSTNFQWGSNPPLKEVSFKEQDHQESLIREPKGRINQYHPIQRGRLSLLSFFEQSFYKYFTNSLQSNLSQNRNFREYPDDYLHGYFHGYRPAEEWRTGPLTWAESFTGRGPEYYGVLSREPFTGFGPNSAGSGYGSALPSALSPALSPVVQNAVSAFSRAFQANLSFIYNPSLNQSFNQAPLSNFRSMLSPALAAIHQSEFNRVDSRMFQPALGWGFTSGLGKNQGQSGDRQGKETISHAKGMELVNLNPFHDKQSLINQSFNKASNDDLYPKPALLMMKEFNIAGNGWSGVWNNLWNSFGNDFRKDLWNTGANPGSGRLQPKPHRLLQPIFAPLREGRFNTNLTLSIFPASEKAGALSPSQQPSSRFAEPLIYGRSISSAILPGNTVFTEPTLNKRTNTKSSLPVRPVLNSRLLDGGLLSSRFLNRRFLSSFISDRAIEKVIDRIIPGIINRVGISHTVISNNSLSLVSLIQKTAFKGGSGGKPYSTRPSLSTSSSGTSYPQNLHSPAALLNTLHFSTPYLNTLPSKTSTLYFSNLYNSLNDVPGRDHPVSDHATPNPLASSSGTLKNAQLNRLPSIGRANQWILRASIVLMARRTPMTPRTPRISMKPRDPWESPYSLLHLESWNREAPDNELSNAAPFEKFHQGQAGLKTAFHQSGFRLIERLLGNVYRTLAHNHMEKYLAGKESFEKSVAGNPLLTLLKSDWKREEQERDRFESGLIENYARFKSELETIKNLFAIRFKFHLLQSGGAFSTGTKGSGQGKSQPDTYSGGLGAALPSPLPAQQSFEAWLFHRRGQVPVTVLRERPIPHLDGEKDIKISRDLRTVSRYGEGAALLQADEARLKELRILRNTQLLALANPISYQDRDREGPDMLILAPPVIAQDYNSGYTRSLPAITYLEEEEKHRLNKQHEPVLKSLNTPVENFSSSLQQTIQNVDLMNPSELNRLVDKVYSQLETRLKREKRRFGF